MSLSELRRLVIERDRCCVVWLVADRSHICRDRWGEAHPADDMERLTLEHVREHAGGRRRDEAGWCVAVCFSANVWTHEASQYRHDLRAYLAGVRVMEALADPNT